MIKENEKEFINMTTDGVTSLLANLADLNEDNNDNEFACGVDSQIIPQSETKQQLGIKKGVNKSICYKCKVNKSSYLNRTEYICKACFLKILNHKFRSNLRAHCKIKHEDYVLVCISGGNNSMALLHWFYATFNDTTSNRKLFFKLKVLHVDNNLLFRLSDDYNSYEKVQSIRAERRKEIEELCIKYGFDYDIVNLEESMCITPFNEENHDNNIIIGSENVMNNYLSLYKSIPKVGSFNEDFNKIMLRNLIFSYAVKHNFNKVVFADSAQALVNNIFSSVVKGRGFSIREDIGYIDSHFLNGKVNVLKPMRDFLTKEVLLYNYINNVGLFYSPLDLIKANGNGLNHHLPYQGNTSHLVEFFFENLQDKMSSTVTTVMGTAEKLKLKEKEEHKVCQFCLSYIDELYNELEVGSIDSVHNE